MTATADTILAIDLGRFKSVACVYSRSRLKVNAKVTPRKSNTDVREMNELPARGLIVSSWKP